MIFFSQISLHLKIFISFPELDFESTSFSEFSKKKIFDSLISGNFLNFLFKSDLEGAMEVENCYSAGWKINENDEGAAPLLKRNFQFPF